MLIKYWFSLLKKYKKHSFEYELKCHFFKKLSFLVRDRKQLSLKQKSLHWKSMFVNRL